MNQKPPSQRKTASIFLKVTPSQKEMFDCGVAKMSKEKGMKATTNRFVMTLVGRYLHSGMLTDESDKEQIESELMRMLELNQEMEQCLKSMLKVIHNERNQDVHIPDTEDQGEVGDSIE